MNTSEDIVSRENSFVTNKFLSIGAIIMVAVNLRGSITGVGPLIGAIRNTTHMSSTLAGLLTTLPLVAFALVSPLAPKLSGRFGIERTLCFSLAGLTVGILVRWTSSTVALFVGMFLIGAGVAMGNVLLPSLIKRDFPNQIGLMTGMYSITMNVFAALASGISVPLSTLPAFGWRGSLGCWAALSLVGCAFLIPRLYKRRPFNTVQSVNLWRSSLAWKITLFMGLQSFTFYVNVSWIPALLQSQGIQASTAGWLLSLMQLVSLPTMFIVPVLASRSQSQRGLVFITVIVFFLGYAGLLTGFTALTWLWVVMIGAAGGSSFGLALAWLGLRTRNSNEASQLSAMAQSVGYLLAALGPMLIGFLHGLTSAWVAPVVVLELCIALMLLTGFGASRNAYVLPRTSTVHGSSGADLNM